MHHRIATFPNAPTIRYDIREQLSTTAAESIMNFLLLRMNNRYGYTHLTKMMLSKGLILPISVRSKRVVTEYPGVDDIRDQQDKQNV